MELALVAPKCRGQVKFFYEMISGWLIPGSRLQPELFTAINFRYKKSPFALMVIEFTPQNSDELLMIKTHLPFITKEIEFGSTSYYQAMQILEMKGMSLSDKTIALQADIAHLLHRFPKVIDSDIYPILRLVMMSCSESFKRLRSQRHLTRLIQIFYRFYRRLFNETFVSHQRHIGVHTFKFDIRLPFETETKCALLFSVSSTGDHEVLELGQVSALVEELSHSKVEKEDCFHFEMKEHNGKFYYIEIPYSPLLNLVELRKKLKERVSRAVQKYVRPIFMPRNEEEVMKNIVNLSRQLRYFRDLPQVMINFEKQSDRELTFRVILVRLLKRGVIPLPQLAEQLGVQVERGRNAGYLRKKVPKEASVFTLGLDPSQFLREDATLDLYKARFEVYRRLKAVLGDVRDFNGGLIAKQRERLEELKTHLRSAQDELLFEDFFFSLYPVEYRVVWGEGAILEFFNAYLIYLGSGDYRQERIEFQTFATDEEGSPFEREIDQFEAPSSSIIRLKVGSDEGKIFGYHKKDLVIVEG